MEQNSGRGRRKGKDRKTEVRAGRQEVKRGGKSQEDMEERRERKKESEREGKETGMQEVDVMEEVKREEREK